VLQSNSEFPTQRVWTRVIVANISHLPQISTSSTWGLVARGRSAKRWISSIHLRWSSWAMSCESLGFGARWVLLRLVGPKWGVPWYTMIYHMIYLQIPVFVMSCFPHWNGRFGYACSMVFDSTSDNMSIQQSAQQRFGLAKWWAMKRTSSDSFHRFCCV